MNEKKKKRRLVPFFLCLPALFAVAFFAWRQRNNLCAVVHFLSCSREELEHQLEQNRQVIRDAVGSDLMAVIAPITDCEQAAPENGEPAREPLPDQPGEPGKEEDAAYQQALEDILARVYLLQEEYTAALENLQKEAAAAFRQLDAGTSKTEFAKKYLDAAVVLEQDCDQKMDTLVAELEDLQKANKKILDLVETLKFTYANEKSLKKAWYMKELQWRGFI